MKLNSKNERIKLAYRTFLKEADGKAPATIEQVLTAIERYEDFTRKADFATYDQRKAIRFKEYLADEELAKATILSTVKHLKRFFGWLRQQPGFRSRIQPNSLEYLNLADREVRAAKTPSDRPHPSLEQVCQAFEAMPADTIIERRDRAVLALLAITGIRDGALISLKLKHFNETEGRILQNPNEVATKNAKRIDTFLIDLAPSMKKELLEWRRELVENELYAPTDPLFPKTEMGHDANDCFVSVGLTREHWATAQPVRDLVRKAFEGAGIPYFHPHTFRHMLTQQAYKHCKTPQQIKAWSQNFGHENVLTTMATYGKLDLYQQREILSSIGDTPCDDDQPLTKKDLSQLIEKLQSG
jgi:integrase